MPHADTETLMTSDSIHTDEEQRLSPLQLGLLTIGLLTTAVGQSFIFAILPPLGREVNLTVLQINTIIASSALVFSAAATVWGRMCDRIGRKPVILIGLTGYAVGNFVFAMIFDAAMRGWLAGPLLFGLILLGRCSQAVVMSGTNPGAAAYAADFSSREHRTKALARLGTASSLGMIIGPIVAGRWLDLAFFSRCTRQAAWPHWPPSSLPLSYPQEKSKRPSLERPKGCVL